jgi:hypothetical protein
MKLLLLIKSIAEPDAKRWLESLGALHFKALSKDVLLMFHDGPEDALLVRLSQGLSPNSRVAIYALKGAFTGLGSSADEENFMRTLCPG